MTALRCIALIAICSLLDVARVAASEPVWSIRGGDRGELPEGVARGGDPPALSFSGTPIRLDAARAAEWLPKQKLTVEAWVKVDEPVQWTGIAGCLQDNDTYERGWVLGCHPTAFYFGIAAQQRKRFTYLDADMQLAEGEWYHVIGTYDGRVQRIYVDGKLAGESQAQKGDIVYAENLLPVVGSYLDANDNIALRGELESLSIWAASLSAEQVARRFEARKALFPGIEGVVDEAAADLNWPTYRHDDQRSGRYPRDLKLPLFPAWIHQPRQAPRPAWPGTAQSDFWRSRSTPEKPLVEFDKAYHVVASGKRVLYCTSADDMVVCLDLQTGEPLWQSFAEGPIRLAPTIVGQRVLFGSDDGFIYCLDLASGNRLWRQSAVEDPGKRRPGNGRIIGKYPVRSGVVVRDEVVYYAAGLFPQQGVWHCALSLADGRRLAAAPLGVSPQGYIRERAGRLFAPTGRHPAGAFLQRLKRRGKAPAQVAGEISKKYPYAFIATPSCRFAGGDGMIGVLDASTGEELAQLEVEGRVLGLAIAGNTLLASTDRGATYAFSTTRRDPPAETRWPVSSYAASTSAAESAAELLSQSGRRRGYALVVGDGRGELTMELARQSQFQVIGVGLSPQQVARQRTAAAEAGFYGRVVAHEVSLDEHPPYLERIFNLVVLPSGVDSTDWLPLLRPGGLLVQGSSIQEAPEVEGGGSWSHLYGDAGNTACSGDMLSTSDLQLQWFGEPGPQHIIDRHLRAMGPVARDGYLFVPGNDYLYGVDAYNGVVLWEKPVASFRRIGVLRGSGSLAVGNNFLYAAAGDHCHVLGRSTGEEVRRLALPTARQAREWGYLAVVDDTVIGSAVKRGGVYRTFGREAIYGAGYGDNVKVTVSDELFAHDAESGERLWAYQPRGAIVNPAIATNRAHVVFLESRNPGTLGGPPRSHYPELLESAGGDIVALDRRTGRVAWRRAFDSPTGIQTLFLSCTDREVVIACSRNAVAADAEEATVHYEARVYGTGGGLRWRRSFDTGKGPNLDHGEQDRHPAIVGSRLIVEPNIYRLKDGELIDTFQRGRGCGTISASANDVFFRSGHPAHYNLTTKKTALLNAVTRPSCWINVITSGGLVLAPEGSSGCICEYPIQCSMVFAPK